MSTFDDMSRSMATGQVGDGGDDRLPGESIKTEGLPLTEQESSANESDCGSAAVGLEEDEIADGLIQDKAGKNEEQLTNRRKANPWRSEHSTLLPLLHQVGITEPLTKGGQEAGKPSRAARRRAAHRLHADDSQSIQGTRARHLDPRPLPYNADDQTPLIRRHSMACAVSVIHSGSSTSCAGYDIEPENSAPVRLTAQIFPYWGDKVGPDALAHAKGFPRIELNLHVTSDGKHIFNKPSIYRVVYPMTRHLDVVKRFSPTQFSVKAVEKKSELPKSIQWAWKKNRLSDRLLRVSLTSESRPIVLGADPQTLENIKQKLQGKFDGMANVIQKFGKDTASVVEVFLAAKNKHDRQTLLEGPLSRLLCAHTNMDDVGPSAAAIS